MPPKLSSPRPAVRAWVEVGSAPSDRSPPPRAPRRTGRGDLVAEAVEAHDLDARCPKLEVSVQAPRDVAKIAAQRGAEALRRGRVAHAETDLRPVRILPETVPGAGLADSRDDAEIRREQDSHARIPAGAPIA